MSGNTFYLTLPSNDGSLKYFPDNKNNSWKNRLDKRIDLEGEWEVGLSSISLPHDSKVSSYLKGLKDDDVLLTTGRVKVATGDIQHKVTYNVTYGDIKQHRIETVHDLLKSLFDEERLKCIMNMGSALGSHFSSGHSAQFEVIADEDKETITVTADKVKSTDITHQEVRDGLYFELPRDMCELFGWTKKTTVRYRRIVSGPIEENRNVSRPAHNLTVTKRGTVWSYDRRLTTSSLAYYRYEIPWKDRFAEKYHRFLLSDLNWTFINTKRSTYLNLPYPRTLYMYSSLCAPVRVGDQTTDLIRQIHYQPILEGNYYYEPKQIHYIKLRKNHIDVVETQISESENNNLAQFTDGASIVTLHFRRVR